MSRITAKCLTFALLLVLVGCRGEAASPAKQPERIRTAAVAGIFYPAAGDELKQQVERLLDLAETEPTGNRRLRALVCPHAGYQFSAHTAAIGYKLLQEQSKKSPISAVILLGPSHYADFDGAFVSATEAYQTPLGLVPVSAEAAKLAKSAPFSAHPRCNVMRPEWLPMSPTKPPPAGEDTPETWEHSLEVQLPLLQRALGEFSIVPIIFGRVEPRTVAEKLLPLLDDHTLIVASSDLSHYHSNEEAHALDARTVKAICELDAGKLGPESACGYAPIVALIDIARRKGWTTERLDYRTSGDVTGDKSRVVGYTAIAFFGPDATASANGSQFTPAQRRLLLELARKSVTAAVEGGQPPGEDAPASPEFQPHRACFVTLTKNGELRGCIGSIFPQESLYKAVLHLARLAALEDKRFSPVRADELKQIEIEVSVLTVPAPLKFASPDDLLAKLRPGIDGVVLSVDGRQATYLPQVWEQLPDRQQFMAQLSAKAGLDHEAWKSPGATVLTYQVEAFKEADGSRKADRGK